MCNSKKLLVVIPYRDRQHHLKIFIPYIHNTLKQQNISLYNIIIVEQNIGDLFNRGLLCNIGFSMYYHDYDYVCFHDIDMIGENFDYTYIEIPTHLSAMDKKVKYRESYETYFGGVTLFPCKDFLYINGFSNNYWGWGAEDDDLKLRCDIMCIPTQRKKCKYYTLPHKTMPHRRRFNHSPGYKDNLFRLQKFMDTRDKNLIIEDGLSNLEKYQKILSVDQKIDYTLVKTHVNRFL